ncbi:hypothetical protein [uncultured Fibrella sp.]|uniref:hypothetical protein n=1 Tax=uncultured Fibrella sp. TaxID=1284596 RepID=UPI0035CB3D79
MPKNSAKMLENPTISGVSNTTAIYSASAASYTIVIPSLLNTPTLNVAFSVPASATVNPASGSLQNFADPVSYTVTAEDGSKQVYTVSIRTPLHVMHEKAQSLYNVKLSPVFSATVTPNTSLTGSTFEKTLDGNDAAYVDTAMFRTLVVNRSGAAPYTDTYRISSVNGKASNGQRKLAYFITRSSNSELITFQKVIAVDPQPEYGFLPMITCRWKVVGGRMAAPTPGEEHEKGGPMKNSDGSYTFRRH